MDDEEVGTDTAIVTSTIEITRVMDMDGRDYIYVEVGGEPSLTETLGMIELAKIRVVDEHMDCSCEDEDD